MFGRYLKGIENSALFYSTRHRMWRVERRCHIHIKRYSESNTEADLV